MFIEKQPRSSYHFFPPSSNSVGEHHLVTSTDAFSTSPSNHMLQLFHANHISPIDDRHNINMTYPAKQMISRGPLDQIVI